MPIVRFLIIFCLCSGAILAQPDRRGPGPGRPPSIEMLARDLDLSREQQEKARALRARNQPLLRAQLDKLPGLHDELRKILEVEKVDLGRVRAQLRKIDDVLIEVRILEISDRLEFEAILSKEQLAKFRELGRKHRERNRPRMDRPEGEP
ncbi:MAG: periplasmic heavy metal sensor [Leptospirales bacterium]|nr:periplasmic heavy metal sensor [Leptospirales bacterium]